MVAPIHNAKECIRTAKRSGIEFSHREGVPVELYVRRVGLFRYQIRAKLLEDIWYRDAFGERRLKKGFAWDLASVPHFLWWFISPFELAYESAFHDDDYKRQNIPRAYADFRFRYLMEQRGQPWYVSWPAWAGVRIGGRSAWNKNAARKEKTNASPTETKDP